MSRPLIAINGCVEGDKLSLRTRYAERVRLAGGVPFAIPPCDAADEMALAAALERADGLLFSGGDDFDTERIGLGAVHPEATPTPPAKQDFDFALARAALAEGIPTLGICYGMQVLGLAEGGDLYQHLPADRPGGREHRGGVEHAVRIQPGTKLERILGVELSVVSRHHQALREVPPPWTVAAVDEDGLVEAIEHRNHPFAIGVQWHPELSPPGTPHDGLFESLVRAAAAGRPAQQKEMTRW